MTSPLRASYASHLTSLTIALYLAGTVRASNKCAPATWLAGQYKARGIDTATTSLPSSASPSDVGTVSFSSSSISVSVTMSPLLSGNNITTGEINCRYSASTKGMDINYYTCMALATKFGISIEKLFQLNPGLHPDCGNIQADTEYCVDGCKSFQNPFGRPRIRLRMRTNDAMRPDDQSLSLSEPQTDSVGLPMAMRLALEQSSSAAMQRPGDAATLCKSSSCIREELLFVILNDRVSTNAGWLPYTRADCADGTCYEGACAGDAVFTTDGECGRQHGYKQCAGIWGDCCNAEGKCGTGQSFCGYGKCQLGNCTVLPQPPKVGGVTPDGTCGGKYQYKCNIAYGECCNRYGLCGLQPSDCGIGW